MLKQNKTPLKDQNLRYFKGIYWDYESRKLDGLKNLLVRIKGSEISLFFGCHEHPDLEVKTYEYN